ncbi:hypothetical protein, partial [Polaromonas sp.]|uniref:hypothetical protein n=1 Tax=Polaromonas sp. TaxID=1869339 RepID=UPI00352465D4
FAGFDITLDVLGMGRSGRKRDSKSEYRGEQLIHFSRTIQVRIRYINSRRLYLGLPGRRPNRPNPDTFTRLPLHRCCPP